MASAGSNFDLQNAIVDIEVGNLDDDLNSNAFRKTNNKIAGHLLHKCIKSSCLAQNGNKLLRGGKSSQKRIKLGMLRWLTSYLLCEVFCYLLDIVRLQICTASHLLVLLENYHFKNFLRILYLLFWKNCSFKRTHVVRIFGKDE